MAPLPTIIEGWQKKCSEVAAQSDDPLVPLVGGAFDALAATTESNQDQANIKCSLKELYNERPVADPRNIEGDPLRDMMHGITEAIHMAMIDITEHRSTTNNKDEQKKGRSRLKRTATRSIDYAVLNGGLVKEEQVDGGLKRHKKQNVKQESTVGGLMQCVLCKYDTSSIQLYCIHLHNRHRTTARKEGIWFRCECGNLSRSANHVRHKKCGAHNTWVVRDEEITGDERSENAEMEDEDDEKYIPHVKQKSVVRAMMQCVLCDHETSSVRSYCNHLKRKHEATPKAVGIWFHCYCGNLSDTEKHARGRKCDQLSTSILRNDEAILIADGYKEENGEEEDEKEEKDSASTNPHCFLCEFRPSTVGGFFKHMAKKHTTTLNLQGYSINCSACGGEFMTNKGQRTHKEIIKCEGRSFSLQKLKTKNEKIKFTLNINRAFPPKNQ